jgi:3-deoxy-D-manno-octulosonic-acid transferase
MQTQADADRMRALSRRPSDVFVTGNCKFDAPLPSLTPEERTALRNRWNLGPDRPTLVVGSTHSGEEPIVLDAFRAVRRRIPDLQLVLSPRHPERFEEVYRLFQQAGTAEGWTVTRATAPGGAPPDVFILDAMGELARAYGLGQVSVVAGSFAPTVGGHNLLEAAAHAVPVVVGPYMHSQKEIDRLFRPADSGCLRSTADTLAQTLEPLFTDPERAKAIGQKALATARSNQGSAQACAETLRPYLA